MLPDYDDEEDYEDEGGPYELRVCAVCHCIMNEDDPGVPGTDQDGEPVLVCTRHVEEAGVMIEEHVR
jgi:hypothetical protein